MAVSITPRDLPRRRPANRGRRVALVCPYSGSWPGGVQTHVAGLAGALRAEGLEVDVLEPMDGIADGEQPVPLGRSVPIPGNGSVQRVALTPAAAVRTARLIGNGRYDIVHLHEPLIPFTCFTALLTARAPLVGTFHMHGPSARWYRVFGPLCRQALSRLRIRIAVSAAARDLVASACPGEYVIVPNGVHTNVPTREHKGRGRTILFIGRPEPRKGLPVLLDAVRRLSPEVRLEIVGVTEQELAEIVGNGGFDASRVRVHGRVGEKERGRLLLEADVLCAPSLRSESFGLVLAEAMAAGAPVVASDIRGYRELVTPGCGRLVAPGNDESLAAALEGLLSDPGLRTRMAAAARARVQAFSWPRVARQVLELYERAAEARRARTSACARRTPA